MNPTTYWATRFALGAAMLALGGLRVPTESLGIGRMWIVDFCVGALGFLMASSAVGPLVRSMTVDAKLRSLWDKHDRDAFLRASPEQQVFLLLLGIAEADGEAGARERELVRQFLLSRFPSPRIQAELDRWSANAKPPRNLEPLARALSLRFLGSDCATIYSWCCLVAFADGALRPAEHKALHAVATGFGLSPRYAQFLFDYAQMSSQRNRASTEERSSGASSSSSSGAHSRSGNGGRRSEPKRNYGTPRERALQTLGLPNDATKEQIRQRHRELARKFHPDAHQRLGPIAQQEASERFKAIQRAYEELSKGA